MMNDKRIERIRIASQKQSVNNRQNIISSLFYSKIKINRFLKLNDLIRKI